MKAAAYSENGAPSVLRYKDVADPDPGPGDLLIRVEAISIEGGDILNRQLVPPPSPDHIVGYQAAGTILAVGAGVKRFIPGQRVAAFNWAGSHAELFVVPEHFVYAVPDDLDIRVAATIPVTFGTADDALFEFGGLRTGETVLIFGASGGVGLAAVQLAHAAGATVIATASGEERAARLKPFGADMGIDHAGQDVIAETMRLTGGRGVDLAIDIGGGPTGEKLLQALRYRGRLAVVGASSGSFPCYPFQDIVPRSATLLGISFGQEMHTRRARDLVESHLAAVAEGRLRMPIDRVFALAEASAAHHHVEFGKPFGRTVMIP